MHDFFRNHEDPPPQDMELPPQRLVELYPLAATSSNFSVKRLSPPRTPGGAEFAARPRARSSALLVLQKCPRTCPKVDAIPRPERLQPPAPPQLRGA